MKDVKDADVAGYNDAQWYHQSHDEHEYNVTASVETRYKIAFDNI
jgi:hypothetical protein